MAGAQLTDNRVQSTPATTSASPAGPVAAAADMALIVPSQATPRIQEVHITIGHVLCDLVDFILYPEKFGDI